MLVFAVLILVVEGYFGYRWYQRYHGEDARTERAGPSVPGGSTKGPEAGAEAGDALVHRADPGNIVENSTYIDDPAANGNPGAVLLVTQAWTLEGTPTNAHVTGVWYDENRGGRWAVFNQDLAPMPEGAVFNVVIMEKPGVNAFVHRSTPANTRDEGTYVDHPSVNATPEAVLSITPSWNPGGGYGRYNDHLVGVLYDADKERWVIRNEDLAAMPDGAAFGVSVLRGTTTDDSSAG